MRNKKSRTLLILLFLVLALSIGFALLSTTLKINGTAGIGKNTWDIHWENVDNESGNTAESSAEINPNDNKEVNFEVNFTIPGEYYEFTVDAVNRGTLDGMLKKIEPTINGETIDDLDPYLGYTITYLDGTTPEENDLLAVNKQITYKIRLEYKRTITNEQLEAIPNDGEPFEGKVTITYIQSNSSAVDKGNTETIPELLELQVGDYFTLVPDASTYTVLGTDTGEGIDQTITPNELTLWRVIKINDDGTYDAVSEYVSSNMVGFSGAVGYAKYVNTLQTIASQYAKSGYTVGTRMMGYDGQTLTIQDTSAFNGSTDAAPSTSPTPGTSAVSWPTTGTGAEYSNGVLGDTLYLKDYQLVDNLYDDGVSAKANENDGYYTTYWLSSRIYFYGGETNFDFCLIHVPSMSGPLSVYCPRRKNSTEWADVSYGAAVRPIITLKHKVYKNMGQGTKGNPYSFK